MTEAFRQGLVNVLVGTKSLLGEGWDSPCINALVLATFVGSFMLSNQMRGRAIRVDGDRPGKTANIWHLVCVEPLLGEDAPWIQRLFYSGLERSRELEGADWETLVRRFDCFMGLRTVAASSRAAWSAATSWNRPSTKTALRASTARWRSLRATGRPWRAPGRGRCRTRPPCALSRRARWRRRDLRSRSGS